MLRGRPGGPRLALLRVARASILASFVSVCALVFALAMGAVPAAAALPFEFGSFGEGAGQVNFPTGVAADSAGDVYVADTENRRVDKYDENGNFLLAWGDGVIDGSHELQTCTAATGCRKGIESSTPDAFEFPSGVAVDNDPSSASFGDVYVIDFARSRVVKFDPSGKFLLALGGHINKATGANVCVAGEECNEEGTQGTEDGEFSAFPLGNVIAVGPGGAVYVGDTARVQVFESTGAWRENISLAGLSAEGLPAALAVDPAGDVFVADGGVEGVHEFEPSGLEALAQFDSASTSVTSLATDAAGHLYVGDSNGGFHVQQYDATGTELASFGANTVSGFNAALAFSNATGELYATDASSEEKQGVWVFSPPPAGPVIDSQSATPETKGDVKLEALVNPEGNEMTYHFEYVDQTRFTQSGYAGATSTPPVSITEGLFEDHSAGAELTGLKPGETYHFRLLATDSLARTTMGADHSFQEIPPALVEGPWASDVAATSATLNVKINPLGASTEYRLEYGTSTTYDHALTGNVGEGESAVPVSHHLQELAPNTTYHFRLVTVNECIVGKPLCTQEGTDHTFTTQPLVGSSGTALPDGRAWELVSPAATGGSVFTLPTSGIQAASDGGAITYNVLGAPLGENAESSTVFDGSQVLSRRTADGWRSQDIEPPQAPPREGEGEGTGLLLTNSAIFTGFSSDLASVVVEPPTFTPLDPHGLEGTAYLRNNISGSVVPLLTAANTPAGTKLESEELGVLRRHVKVVGRAGESLLLRSPLKLTGEAIATTDAVFGNLYELTAGRVRLVNILPNNEPSHDPEPAFFAGESAIGGTVARVISTDGRWIAWTRGTPYESRVQATRGLYLRDMIAGKTVQLGGAAALYQTMSSDGSRVFFLEEGDLYEYDVRTGVQTDLTASHGAGEASAGVQESVSNVSEDGTHVYFVAKGKLAEGATGGEDNLYLSHDSGGVWTTSHIATLAPEDSHSWHATSRGGTEPILTGVASRVSPDGRYLTFMSQRPLTGYDNIDLSERQTEEEVDGKTVTTTVHRDEEVYLYDAATHRLACASCDPTGARPRGLFTGPGTNAQLVEHVGAFAWAQVEHPHWLAGSLPLWQGVDGGGNVSYQPRYLSDSGRLYFNSPEPLVPQDTNGLEDVYQYEPPGIGSCTATSSTFNPRSSGCVNLLSSGTSRAESAFYDASETGDDAFFISSDHLTAADQDSGYDVWDAHVCSVSSPCLTSSVSPPACSSGDSCKPAPASQPELFGPAPSATFSGAGNITPARRPRRSR